ncbi:hypothetical protein FGB62_93g023 [Gracilaria domingensis]|nr:hypothetical protein FGB62_93g023 [Gracilaria domingensis]
MAGKVAHKSFLLEPTATLTVQALPAQGELHIFAIGYSPAGDKRAGSADARLAVGEHDASVAHCLLHNGAEAVHLLKTGGGKVLHGDVAHAEAKLLARQAPLIEAVRPAQVDDGVHAVVVEPLQPGGRRLAAPQKALLNDVKVGDVVQAGAQQHGAAHGRLELEVALKRAQQLALHALQRAARAVGAAALANGGAQRGQRVHQAALAPDAVVVLAQQRARQARAARRAPACAARTAPARARCGRAAAPARTSGRGGAGCPARRSARAPGWRAGTAAGRARRAPAAATTAGGAATRAAPRRRRRARAARGAGARGARTGCAAAACAAAARTNGARGSAGRPAAATG